MHPLLRANNISLIKEKKRILDNVSLQIERKGFVTIIGPNGAGKSLLLKCLLGIEKPSNGEIWQKKNLRIGYLPQKIYPNPTIPISTQNFLQLKQKKNQEEIDKIARETDCQSLLKTPLYSLSGGEMQRVLLARALSKKPEILILDEPDQNLDVNGQLEFYQLLENIYQQYSLAILMVSHNLHFVMASTKQVICLFHHICCSGTPQAISKEPEFISLFGKKMTKQLKTYRHMHNHHHK